MAKGRDELTRLEWLLMDSLWSAQRATASDLQKSLEPTQGWAYSTVKTMLDRLVEMGFVQTRRVGNVYEYSPKIKRPKAVDKVLDDLVDRLFGGSVAPLVESLLERRDVDPEEIAKLKLILKQHQNKS